MYLFVELGIALEFSFYETCSQPGGISNAEK